MNADDWLREDLIAIRASVEQIGKDVAVLQSHLALMAEIQRRVGRLERQGHRAAGFAAALGLILGWVIQILGRKVF